MAGGLVGCALFDPAPVANFSWTPSEPLSRVEVQFTDDSTDTSLLGAGGIATWSWDFGDSQSSTAQNPKHTYQSAGTFAVRLTVTDTSGNSTTKQKTITILPSLNGRWEGTLYDPTPWPFVLNINHSATGGISGTSSLGAWSSTISSASFSQTTLQVRIAFGVGVAATVVLVGNYNPATKTVSGHWEDFFLPGVNLGPFDMHLQP
jgi:PKD repeat protein